MKSQRPDLKLIRYTETCNGGQCFTSAGFENSVVFSACIEFGQFLSIGLKMYNKGHLQLF